MSTTLRRLESDDPRIGGFLIAFDTNVAKACHWHATGGPIHPVIDAAKHYTAVLLDTLLRERREAEVRDTNWVSVAAAVAQLIGEFNACLARVPTEPQPPIQGVGVTKH